MAARKPKKTNKAPKKRSRPDWAPRFLEALCETANISAACAAAGVKSRQTVYTRRDSEPDFAVAMAEALEVATDTLELEARRRAKDGCDRPVFHQGIQCGTVREYSDTLMIFLLKAHRPEKFRDRLDLRHSGRVKVKADSALADAILNDPDAADLACRLLERVGPGPRDAGGAG